jgi:hypothetical protein
MTLIKSASGRLVLQGVQAATEYALVVVWGSAALFAFLVAHGPHAHDRFYLTLGWALRETRLFLFCGALLFLAALGMHRAGFRLSLIRIAGGVLSPVLGVAAGLRSFPKMWLYQPGYNLLVPVLFLAEFILWALGYGVLLLPRHLKSGAVPRLHIHWAIVALLLPPVPLLILRAVNPNIHGPIFSLRRSKSIRFGEVIFARWTPGSDPLTVEPFDMHLPQGGAPQLPSGYTNLNDEEIQRLHLAGVGGHIKVSGMSALINAGRLTLIMSQQVDAPFQFRAPVEGSSVTYLQTSGGWRKIPPEAGESQWVVRLYVPEGKPSVTGFELDNGKDAPSDDETRYLWDQ